MYRRVYGARMRPWDCALHAVAEDVDILMDSRVFSQRSATACSSRRIRRRTPKFPLVAHHAAGTVELYLGVNAYPDLGRPRRDERCSDAGSL